MFRTSIAAACLVAMACCTSTAGEVAGLIIKVQDDNVTFLAPKPGEPFRQSTATETTLPVAKDVKVFMGKRTPGTRKYEAGDELAGGIKNDQLKKADRVHPAGAHITTDDSGKMINSILIIRLPGQDQGPSGKQQEQSR